jgi:hypothetical protein
MKRNVLAFGRCMDLDRNGHQAKGEDAAGDRSSHRCSLTEGKKRRNGAFILHLERLRNPRLFQNTVGRMARQDLIIDGKRSTTIAILLSLSGHLAKNHFSSFSKAS